MFSAGAGVFFAGAEAGAGGEKPGVCTALTKERLKTGGQYSKVSRIPLNSVRNVLHSQCSILMQLCLILGFSN